MPQGAACKRPLGHCGKAAPRSPPVSCTAANSGSTAGPACVAAWTARSCRNRCPIRPPGFPVGFLRGFWPGAATYAVPAATVGNSLGGGAAAGRAGADSDAGGAGEVRLAAQDGVHASHLAGHGPVLGLPPAPPPPHRHCCLKTEDARVQARSNFGVSSGLKTLKTYLDAQGVSLAQAVSARVWPASTFAWPASICRLLYGTNGLDTCAGAFR